MSAILLFSRRADKEVDNLPDRNLKQVLSTFEFLCDFLRGAQTAGWPKHPEVRRAVAGSYLIFYEYDEETQEIYVHAIRHGRQKPLTARDILPRE